MHIYRDPSNFRHHPVVLTELIARCKWKIGNNSTVFHPVSIPCRQTYKKVQVAVKAPYIEMFR